MTGAVSPDMTVVATPDMTMAPKPDMKKLVDLFDPTDYGGITCGSTSCSGANVCCTVQVDGGFSQMCMSSCSDGGITQSCDGPEDCGSGVPFCCGALKLGAGNFPNCPLVSATSACAAACNTDIQFACAVTDKVRLCHHEAECADDGNSPNCCELSMGGAKIRACVSDLIKGAAGAPCF